MTTGSLPDKLRRRVVVLSPHLDDAVLAIGALLCRMVDEGARVEVMTAFCGDPDPANVSEALRPFADHHARREEDRRALARVGALPIWLGEIERAFRPPGFERPREIVKTPATLRGFATLDRLEATITELLDDAEATLIAPLAVGHHCDHVELALAAMRTLDRCDGLDRAYFYEDPYATSAVLRRAHFVTRALPLDRWPALGHPHMGLLLASLRLFAHGPALDDYLPQARRWTWTHQLLEIETFEADMFAAIACYRSQVAEFGGMRGIEAMIRRYHRGFASAAASEPLWSAAR